MSSWTSSHHRQVGRPIGSLCTLCARHRDSISWPCGAGGAPAPRPAPTPGGEESGSHEATCLRGWYFDAHDPRHCLACPAGRFDGDGYSTTECKECQAGYYAAEGATECSACSDGMYDGDQTPSTPCVQCPAGRWQNRSAATDCLVCGKGGVELAQETSCSACPVGRQVSNSCLCVGPVLLCAPSAQSARVDGRWPM
eukprot:COSAG01_NODE_160_length_23692_cov_9.703599_36_plen_197_part_00